MARREYNVKSDVFPSGLVFYAPMSQGDLTDHISGNSLVIANPNKVTWDSDNGMYRVQKDTKANEMYWSVDLTLNMEATAEQNYTMYCWAQRLNTNQFQNYPMFFIIGSYRQSDTFNPSCFSMKFEDTVARELVQAHITRKNGTVGNFITYHDDTLDNYYNENLASTTRHYCNNWVNDNWAKVAVNPQRHANDTNIAILVSNIMIFNRALSDSELIYLSTNFTNWL